LEYLTEDTLHLERKVKPNFKTLGKKVGKHMKEVAAWVNAISAEDLKTFETTGKLEAVIQGIEVEFEPEDIEISYADIPGWQVASDGQYLVALDVHIDDALKAEGMARELVNRVQNFRKEADLEVTDRIHIKIAGSEQLNASFERYKNYICAEVLADTLLYFDDKNALEYKETEIDGIPLFIEISKVK
ncbi:MAG: DUF5915 domain-containing protein, partial [Bacteroidota bacterium]|nr:DUF5915 domain-containing protein [Bacteroidota bacterium]MDX5431487.1 DUF5915 domain-containing protein [Bacteroidota bacterium]MDX5470211.1 DUF5915 domain-containing protein [Bacteroidota bacterium]